MTTASQANSGAGRPAFKPSAELYPFQSRWFDSTAGGVHYVDEGEGQPIIL